jgi:hypothetical protein
MPPWSEPGYVPGLLNRLILWRILEDSYPYIGQSFSVGPWSHRYLGPLGGLTLSIMMLPSNLGPLVTMVRAPWFFNVATSPGSSMPFVDRRDESKTCHPEFLSSKVNNPRWVWFSLLVIPCPSHINFPAAPGWLEQSFPGLVCQNCWLCTKRD